MEHRVNPTNKPAKITLGGRKYNFYLNMNTFAAFDESTGKFFMDFIVSMQEAFSKAYALDPDTKQMVAKDPRLVARTLQMADFRAFVWAGVHEYVVDRSNGREIATWPLSIYEVGKLLDLKEMLRLLPVVISANTDNLPQDADNQPVSLQEESGSPLSLVGDPAKASEDESSQEMSGGPSTGLTDASILENLTKKSVN